MLCVCQLFGSLFSFSFFVLIPLPISILSADFEVDCVNVLETIFSYVLLFLYRTTLRFSVVRIIRHS